MNLIKEIFIIAVNDSPAVAAVLSEQLQRGQAYSASGTSDDGVFACKHPMILV